MKEGAAGCTAGHLALAGHQTGHAVARTLEEFSNGERDGQQKTLYRQNNE